VFRRQSRRNTPLKSAYFRAFGAKIGTEGLNSLILTAKIDFKLRIAVILGRVVDSIVASNVVNGVMTCHGENSPHYYRFDLEYDCPTFPD